MNFTSGFRLSSNQFKGFVIRKGVAQPQENQSQTFRQNFQNGFEKYWKESHFQQDF